MAGTRLTATTIGALLARHDVRPRRALGQHFLADPNTAERIVRLAGVTPGDDVWEIGPGVGSLTVALADAGARVLALERDRALIPVLEDALGAGRPTGARVRIVAGDALEVDLVDLLGDRACTLVANLPYNVAVPIVMRVLDEAPGVARMLVMVQREVGERLAAGPGGHEYGSVSVRVAYDASARLVGTVSRTVFLPPPKVESALVELVRHARPPVTVPSRAALFELVGAGFATRRKMLRGALRPVLGDRAPSVLAAAGVDPRARAEELALAEWAAIAREAAA